MKAVKFTGIGSYIPSRRITNEDWEKLVETSDEWIMKNVGIKTRSRIEPESTTTDMGVNAGKIALETAGIEPGQLDYIICGTNTQDHMYPSTASKIQNKLGAVNAASMDVQAGCTGWLFSMSLATGLLASDQAKKILVIGSDALSRALSFYDRSSLLFGDGSGAAVLEQSEGASSDALPRPIFANRTAPSLSMEQATIIQEDKNRVEDYLAGKDMSVVERPLPHMEGKGSLKLALNETRAALDDVLAQARAAGVKREDIKAFVPHQTNAKVVQALCQHAGFEFESIPYTLEKYGGISTAGLPTGIYEHYRAGKIKDGDLVLSCGYGAGFTSGAMLARFNVKD